MRRRNCIGRDVARLRSERNWTQKILAARLQCKGANVSRETLAKIELGHTKATDEFIIALQKVFRLPIIRLFPKAIQEQDQEFAKTDAAKSLKSRLSHAKD
jgi:transcriptional regulator with XRE-family HTH domain